MSTWIKLHRKVIDNEVFRNDFTAWHVFEVLLIMADKNTGKWSGGLFQLSELTGIKKDTLYKCIKRLENAKMISRLVNTQYTVYSICKWSEYQRKIDSQQTAGKQPVNNEQTAGKTLTRIKNKELEINNNVEIQSIYDHYVKCFEKNENRYKLSTNRKRLIATRLKDCGSELILEAITNISKQPFYRGDNDRGWSAGLEFILRNYEQVERFADMKDKTTLSVSEMQKDMEYVI